MWQHVFSPFAMLIGGLLLPDQHLGLLDPLPAEAAAGLASACWQGTCLLLSCLSCTQAFLPLACLGAAQDTPCSNRSCCNLVVQIPHMNGVAKIDLEEQDPKKAVAGVYSFEDSWVGGESYFVPASEDPAACDGEQALPPLPSFEVCAVSSGSGFAHGCTVVMSLQPRQSDNSLAMCKCPWCGCTFLSHESCQLRRPASKCRPAHTLQVRMMATC